MPAEAKKDSAFERIGWKFKLPVPGADYDNEALAVEEPLLTDACGTDGRFMGATRSFPGFKGLKINESWVPTSYGVRVVGPGISTTSFWMVGLPRGGTGVDFFKPIEFKKSNSTSQIISGFVVMMQYTGATWNGVAAGTKGLPTDVAAGGIANRRVIAFIYWDDDGPGGDGWYCRILNKTAVDRAPIAEVQAEGGATLDCSSWAEFGYVVNPHATDTDESEWGSPDRAAAIAGADSSTGPTVLYYDTTNKWVGIRQMGPTLAVASQPQYGATVPAIHAANGLILSTGANATFNLGVTLFNANTGSRSEMHLQRTMVATAGVTCHVHAELQLHTDSWNSYTHVELWRSALGNPGLLYREHQISIGAAAPAFNGGLGDVGSFRNYWVAWGVDVAATEQAAHPGFRYDLLARGQHVYSLLLLQAYDGVWEFAGNPPVESSRIIVDQDVSYVVAAKGDNEYDAAVTWPARPFMPSRMRWSSLVIPRPENYSEINNLWYPDEEVGMVYGFTKAADNIFAVGTRSLLSVRRLGNRVAISAVGQHLYPVSRRAWTNGGGVLFLLARSGLYAVNAIDGTVQRLRIANRLLFLPEEWGFDLCSQSAEIKPHIGIEYDEVGNCLFIWNLFKMEAVVYWLGTGLVTRLHDFPWRWSGQATIPIQVLYGAVTYSTGFSRRAVFFWETEVDQGSNTNIAPLDVFFADFGPEAGNIQSLPNLYMSSSQYTMHGGAGVKFDPESESAFLQGTIQTATAGGVGLGFVQIALSLTNAVTAGEAGLLNLRWSGGFIHLWSADYTQHFRFQVHFVEVGAIVGGFYTLKVWLGGGALDGGTATAVVGGTALFAPVFVRVIPKLMQEGELSSVHACRVRMDIPDLRWIHDGALNLLRPVYENAQQLLMWASAFELIEDELDDENSYGCHEPSMLLLPSPSKAFPHEALPPMRLRRIASAKITPNRRVDRTAVGLAANLVGGTVGIEAYPSGCILELKELTVGGTIKGSNRRS